MNFKTQSTINVLCRNAEAWIFLFHSYILVGGKNLRTHFLTAHPHLMAANTDAYVLLILSIYQILLTCDIIILCPD